MADNIQRISDHVKKNEGYKNNPYSDTKGNVTVGIGFMVPNADSFARMPFQVTDSTSGKNRPATEVEKQAEFQRIKAGGKDSPLVLPDAEINRRFNQEISQRVGAVKKDIGESDWNKLTDGQKAVLVDVHYARGSLATFPKLKKAVKDGNVEDMATNSDFTGGQRPDKTPIYNYDRLRRNQAEMREINPDSPEAYRAIAEKHGTQPNLPPEYKKHLPQAKTPANDPQVAGEVAPPSVPAPVPPPRPVDTPPPAPQAETKPVPPQAPVPPPRPEVQSLVETLKKPPSDPNQFVALKQPKTWTEEEVKRMSEMCRQLPDSDPRKQGLWNGILSWYKYFYPGKVQLDATGKMIDPQPAFPLPQEPAPLTTAEGHPFDEALGRFGQHVAAAAGDTPVADLVTGLQAGLNLVNTKNPAERTFTPLAEDGDFGPKTQGALYQTLARHGSGKTAEALALGRFNTFARQSVDRPDAQNLKSTTESAFAPLFPLDARKETHPKVAELLQHTLNDLGTEQSDSPPITVDGDIGPQTTDAFARTVKASGAERVSRRFAQNLGFL